jgi:hypothetical protein
VAESHTGSFLADVLGDRVKPAKAVKTVAAAKKARKRA